MDQYFLRMQVITYGIAAAAPHSTSQPSLQLIPFLLRVPAAVAALPHATLAVTQPSPGSQETTLWQLDIVFDSLALQLDIDIDSQVHNRASSAVASFHSSCI